MPHDTGSPHDRPRNAGTHGRRAGSYPPLPALLPSDPGHYRLFPATPLPRGTIGLGFDEVASRLADTLARGGRVYLDGSVGVAWPEMRAGLEAALARRGLSASWFDAGGAMRDEASLDAALAPYLGDDPVFGRRYPGGLADLFEPARLSELAGRVADETGPVVVFGSGAALVAVEVGSDAALGGPGRAAAFVAYLDVPKNEIQYRARAGAASNLGKAAPEDAKTMYKRFYFVDWPVSSRHKRELLPRLDAWIDAQRPREPACLSGEDLRAGLAAMARRPFRARPWFEPGVWGGQWLRRLIPELPRDAPNYAWSFELIAPENGVVFEAEGRLLEASFDTLMFQEHERVLGPRGRRFGDAFPIRFDFLDTVEGGNLSLQCHPTRPYLARHFGEPLMTQHESYYLLHAEPDAEVYLGFQGDVDPAALRQELEASAREGRPVDVRHHVRAHPARAHRLYLIPAGTVHCSGAGNVVLEISSTPYIFTFKMYDWLRRDLDGRPRPLNVERAFEVLDFTRRGAAVEEELIARPRTVFRDGPDRVVHLPTHPEHDYDVRRLEVERSLDVRTEGSCHVLSLVEGRSVLIETAETCQRYYFAETVVVPAAVGSYRVRSEDGRPLAMVQAFLKPARPADGAPREESRGAEDGPEAA